ncbi:DNA replication/repair protein RecF [Thermaurantiacus sp.]
MRSLALGDFRNHLATRIEAGAAPAVVLVGPNGAGKTAVLEALSLLSPGRGLRGAAIAELARTGGPGSFRVKAALATDAGLPPLAIETLATPERPARRQVLLGGAPVAASSLGDSHAILWLTPAMDRLFAEGAGERRRFLDRLVLALHPGHAGHAIRYEAALRQRNRLLAGEAEPDRAWMDALEAEMGRHGEAVAAARAETVCRLEAELSRAPPDGFPRPHLAIAPEPPGLADRLRAARAGDRAAGRTREGPHRADLVVTLGPDGRPASLASTGEQKALVVATLLAHAALVSRARGQPPLLLLDEAAAHFDPDRRRALWAAIGRLGGQAWLTGTDPALFAGLDALCLEVREGAIVRDFRGTAGMSSL